MPRRVIVRPPGERFARRRELREIPPEQRVDDAVLAAQHAVRRACFLLGVSQDDAALVITEVGTAIRQKLNYVRP